MFSLRNQTIVGLLGLTKEELVYYVEVARRGSAL